MAPTPICSSEDLARKTAKMKNTNSQNLCQVWNDLQDSQEAAASITIRSELMLAIRDKVRGWNMTQAHAARRLGITQACLNDLVKQKLSKFSSEHLLMLAVRAGLKVTVDIQTAKDQKWLESPAVGRELI